MTGRDRGKKKMEEGGGSRPTGYSFRPTRQSESDDSRLTPDMAESSMSGEEIEVIREQYGVSDDFILHEPGPSDRVNDSPTGQIAIYEEYMRAGLRFPITGFTRNLLDFYNLSPGQLVPNSIRLIIGFIIVCRLVDARPRMGLFRPMFTLCRHPKAKGWWMFKTREGRFLSDLPSSIHGWKNRFFYASFSPESLLASWGFSPAWGEPRTSSNKDKKVSPQDQVDFARLNNVEIPPLRDLINEDMLYDAGIGPTPKGNPPGRTQF